MLEPLRVRPETLTGVVIDACRGCGKEEAHQAEEGGTYRAEGSWAVIVRGSRRLRGVQKKTPGPYQPLREVWRELILEG